MDEEVLPEVISKMITCYGSSSGQRLRLALHAGHANHDRRGSPGVHAAGHRLQRAHRAVRLPHPGPALHWQRRPQGRPQGAVGGLEAGGWQSSCRGGAVREERLLQPALPTAAPHGVAERHVSVRGA